MRNEREDIASTYIRKNKLKKGYEYIVSLPCSIICAIQKATLFLKLSFVSLIKVGKIGANSIANEVI